jgi:RNA polymerase-binding transcription factor DksA
MSKHRAEVTRETLVARRRDLMRRSEGLLAEEQRLLEEVQPDWQEAAATLTTVRLLDRMSDAELLQLRRVQAALDRIDAGTYGHCLRCGQLIERARLEALPECDRCIDCSLASGADAARPQRQFSA